MQHLGPKTAKDDAHSSLAERRRIQANGGRRRGQSTAYGDVWGATAADTFGATAADTSLFTVFWASQRPVHSLFTVLWASSVEFTRYLRQSRHLMANSLAIYGTLGILRRIHSLLIYGILGIPAPNALAIYGTLGISGRIRLLFTVLWASSGEFARCLRCSKHPRANSLAVCGLPKPPFPKVPDRSRSAALPLRRGWRSHMDKDMAFRQQKDDRKNHVHKSGRSAS